MSDQTLKKHWRVITALVSSLNTQSFRKRRRLLRPKRHLNAPCRRKAIDSRRVTICLPCRKIR